MMQPNARGRLEPGHKLETRPVLAGRYRGKEEDRNYLTHSLVVDADDHDVRVLCGFRVEGLADHYASSDAQRSGPPSCPRCLERWERLQMQTNARSRPQQLWKYNQITGYWVAQRSVTDETAQKWLSIFQRDEPREHFTISRNKPSGKPFSFERHTPNSATHYVWLLDYRGVPLETEGPYGPMSLERAEQFARIGATKGDHDRVVSVGDRIMSDGFEILRRYRRGTGEMTL